MTPQIAQDGSYVSLDLDNKTRRFHAVWLRDNSLHPDVRDPGNGQRLLTLADQPEAPQLAAAVWVDAQTLRVRFCDAHTEHDFPRQWLIQHCYDVAPPTQTGWTAEPIVRWDSGLQAQLPSADFAQIAQQPHELSKWLAAVRRYGFAVLHNLPDDPQALLDVVALFGFVRETNYGRFFDVRSEVNAVNLAYTGLGLQAHTDNPYRDPVPTLQLLACIENTTDGGESLLVDGFAAANTLARENPQHFHLLSRYCARFHYAGANGVSLTSKRPMLELNPDGELIAVRFNNRSASAFCDIPFADMAQYYRAYRHFAQIIERQSSCVRFKLKAGELFIVDNTRVLHSRTAFSAAGTRWLRGCYADKDGLLSTLATLESQP